jgi:lysozyme family protein
MEKNHFRAALSATLAHEGGYNADKLDPGGQTYMGISRVYWPSWSGWLKIDEWLHSGKSMDLDLTDDVEDFYYVNFWGRIQGDRIAKISPAVALEVFDTAVNMGVSTAVRFLQTAINMQNIGQKLYPDLEVDGKLGPKTIEALRQYVTRSSGNRAGNEAILLNCLNGEQYIAYKDNPRHEYFRGWFMRV